jgi:hypothetical protein
MHIHHASQKSLNERLPGRKLMETIFWDMNGVLMVEFVRHGATIMSEVYCETLKRLRGTTPNKRHG